MTVTIDGVTLGHPTYNQNRADIAAAFPTLCNSAGAVGYFRIDTTTLTNGMHTIVWLVYDNQNRGDGIGSRFFTVQNGGGTAAPEADVPLVASPIKGSEHVIEVDELGRIELPLGAISSDRLPIGSRLKAGVFYWQLAPGFLGDYTINFRRPDGTPIKLKIKVRPAGAQN